MNKTSMNIMAGLMAGAGLLCPRAHRLRTPPSSRFARIVLGFPAGGPLDQHALC